MSESHGTIIESELKVGETYVYAETANGREIRGLKTPKGVVYQVQPKNDNYWITCRTPEQCLLAYDNPHRYLATSDRLRAQHGL